MKVPILKRMVVEDFPSQQRSGLAPLIQNVNDISDNLVIALNKNISVSENLDAQVQQISFLYRNVAPFTFPITFKISMKKRPTICMVGNAQELSTTDYPNPGFVTGPAYVSWQVNVNNEIQINNVTGLTVNNAVPHLYQITLILM